MRHDGNKYVLVFGLPRSNRTLTLAPGMSLIPLPAPLDLFDLMALGAAGFRESAVLDPFTRRCTCEVESPVDSAMTPGFDSLNRVWLALALLVLRGFTEVKGVAVSSYRWGDVPIPQHAASWEHPVAPASRRARSDLPKFNGGLLDVHLRMLRLGSNVRETIEEEDAAWVSTRFMIANNLAASHEGFRLALLSAVDWRFSNDVRSAIARIWCGIEAILAVTAELVYRLSMSAASLLEERGAARIACFRRIKKLYGVRSKAVHGDALKESQLDAALVDSFSLLRDLLILQLNRGEVLSPDDLDRAIMS